MKSVLVIIALATIAGCSGMRHDRSSGSMGSDYSSGAPDATTPSVISDYPDTPHDANSAPQLSLP